MAHTHPTATAIATATFQYVLNFCKQNGARTVNFPYSNVVKQNGMGDERKIYRLSI